MSDEPRRRVYTKDPAVLLDPGERPIYDAMLLHSKVLKVAATEGIHDLMDMIHEVKDAPDGDEKTTKAQEMYYGLHRLLAYAFTLGASFAFDEIAKTMGPKILETRRKES